MTRLIPCLFLSLAACGPSTSPLLPDGGTSPGGAEAEVNGKPASEYYAQLSHEETRTFVGGAGAFAPQPDGRNMFLLQVFLRKDKSFVAFYKEGTGEVTATGYSGSFEQRGRRLAGTWSTSGARLVLGDLAQCDGVTLNNRPALHCTLSRSVVTAAANGRSAMLKPGISASTPDDSAWASYD